MANSIIKVPGHGSIQYADHQPEKELLSFRPDISAVYDNTPIYFEIIVTNRMSSQKEYFFFSKNHLSISIDLSKFIGIGERSQIEHTVLEQMANKRIIYWAEPTEELPVPKPVSKPVMPAQPPKRFSIEDLFIIGAFVAIAIYVINKISKWLRGKK